MAVALSSSSPGAWGWGKQGHQLVGQVAARVVSGEPESKFMKSMVFDFGYYNYVPDAIWKKPETYEKEKNEHFMDMEIFERAFKEKGTTKMDFRLSRKEFEAKYPDIKAEAGRAFWRIREMEESLRKITNELKALSEESGKERQALQEKWLVLAGTMGHYVADLGQPLHCTENYDGAMTDQRGIHAYFEIDLVDENFPDLSAMVHKQAANKWKTFHKTSAQKSVLDLLIELAENSRKDVKTLLALDKRKARTGSRKEAKRFEPLMVRHLVQASLTLAEIYSRHLGWKYDGNKFYFFAGEPAYIPAGEAK